MLKTGITEVNCWESRNRLFLHDRGEGVSQERQYRRISLLTVRVIEATYDKLTEQLTIVIGSISKTQEISSSVVRYYFPMTINMNESTFYGGTLTGTYGLAYNDLTEEENCPASVERLPQRLWPSFGLIGYQSQQYVHFSDLYYANGSMYLVRMDTDTGDSSQNDVRRLPHGSRS